MDTNKDVIYLNSARCVKLKIDYWSSVEGKQIEVDVKELVRAYNSDCDEAHQVILGKISNTGLEKIFLTARDIPGWFEAVM